MRRMTLRLGIAALTCAVGLVIVSLTHVLPKLKAIFSEPNVEAPPLASLDQAPYEVYPEARTTDDFDQFWSEFKSAVARDDKEKLYTLVHCNEFSWDAGEVNLKDKRSAEISDHYRVIRNYDDFARNYSKIFPAFIKRAILSRQPMKSNGFGGYDVQWVEGKGRYKEFYTLMFFNNEDYGYKFMGALVGPGY